MKKNTLGMVALSVVLVLSVSACAFGSAQIPSVVSLSQTSTPQQSQPTLPVQAVSSDQTEAMVASQGTLEQIYEQVNPSVVNIRVTTQVSRSQVPFGFPFGSQSPDESQTQEALGSGFVLDTEGHIVTNNHVVSGADTIVVTFQGGTTVPAKVVGTDPDSDLAVIQVEGVAADRLHPVQFADSTQLKVGQMAVAIGNPFGLEGTMTVGIISALGRALSADSTDGQGSIYSIPDVIQTDAAINPGNSGGVLVDDTGRVIGVTSAIVSSTNSSAGIGFAIPSVIVQKVAPKLISDGKYQHPRLGISGTSLNSELATAMNLNPDQRGALVVEIQAGGPADKAGLHGSTQSVSIENRDVQIGGDVIVGIDGHPVNTFDDLSTYLARYTEVGQTIKLTVLRDGKMQDVSATLDARPAIQTSDPSSNPLTEGAYLGIHSITMIPPLAEAMNLSPDQQGVLIIQVAQGSPAEQAGLRGGNQSVRINGQLVPIGGDIIVSIDGQAVDSGDMLRAILQQHQRGDKITITVLRDGKEVQVEVTLGERPMQ